MKNVMAKIAVKAKMNEMKFKDAIQNRKKGSGALDMLIIMLIIVIVGIALLKIMEKVMPELFESIINKVKSSFDVT